MSGRQPAPHRDGRSNIEKEMNDALYSIYRNIKGPKYRLVIAENAPMPADAVAMDWVFAGAITADEIGEYGCAAISRQGFWLSRIDITFAEIARATARYEAAIREMAAVFVAAWSAGSATVVGYVPEVRGPGAESQTLPDRSKYWARISTQMVLDDAVVGRDDSGMPIRGGAGLVFVQCFGPKIGYEPAKQQLQQLVEIARRSFEGPKSPSGLRFENARLREPGSDREFQWISTVAEFFYSETATPGWPERA
jgi:hypothetical protein